MAAVRSARLDGLTSLGGVAAAVVFLHHVPEVLFPGGVNSFGYVGVTFFYVLSGFVLTWSSSNFRGSRRFYLRRIARVYPSHVAVFLVILLAAPLHVPKQGERLPFRTSSSCRPGRRILTSCGASTA